MSEELNAMPEDESALSQEQIEILDLIMEEIERRFEFDTSNDNRLSEDQLLECRTIALNYLIEHSVRKSELHAVSATIYSEFISRPPRDASLERKKTSRRRDI